jgi:uncharacterized RDD family membrane protein YckC
MADRWWYSHKGSEFGPFPPEELQRLIDQNVIAEDTLLWSEGMPAWEPLSSLLAPKPPPLPPRQADSSPAKSLRQPLADEKQVVVAEVGRPASARRRLSARFIDVWIESMVVAFVSAVALSLVSTEFAFWLQRPGSNGIFGLLFVFPLAFVLNAAIYGIFGNTFGKALMSLRVTTTDGRRLRFSEYLWRNFNVWAFGFAAGFPLFSLFSMGYQGRRVSKGEAAGYDIGRYRVDGDALSTFRTVAALAVFAGLGIAMVGLSIWDKEEDRKLQVQTAWTNPVTSIRVDIPAGWIYSLDKNSLGHSIHTFTSPAQSTVAVFAMEDTAGRPLGQYFGAFAVAVASSMTLSPDTAAQTVGTRRSLVAKGYLANDATRKLQLSFVERGTQVWRFIAIGSSSRDPDSAATRELRAKLFSSL